MVEHQTRDLRSKVRILVQVQIFLFKSDILISQGINYKFVSTYQIDFKYQNKDEVTLPVNIWQIMSQTKMPCIALPSREGFRSALSIEPG